MNLSHVNPRVRVLAALPTPPPYSGPEFVADQLLRTGVGPNVDLFHVRTNVHAHNADKGYVTLASLANFAVVWARLVGAILTKRPSMLYLFLSQNTTGFIRDALLIGTARLAGLPVVVHVHGSNFDNFRRDASWWMRKLIEAVFRQVSDVVVLAERFTQQFTGLTPPDRLWVVHNAVESDPSRVVARRASECTILFMGHLSRAKGFADLVEAAPRVLDAVPGSCFEFAGEWLTDEQNIHRDETGRLLGGGWNVRERFAQVAAQYGNRVRLLGIVSGAAKADAFRRAQIFVLPSYSEGLPTAVLEAMAVGLPLVVTPVGAFPEILVPGRHVLFVKPGDVAALSAALVRLATNPDERGRMGEANAALVQEQFAPAKIAEDLARCFRAAVGRRGGSQRSCACSF